MWQVIGQTKGVNSLECSLEEGRLSHAYLFIGPQHVGKMTLAVNLAQALNCVAEEKPCGQCRSCSRITSGNHPDIQMIGRAEKEIGIGQIRDMQHAVRLKPYEGDHRVIIVDGAEHMSEEAANSLLKILEEPPPNTIIILLAVDDSLLLPTILSRCQRLDLPPLPIPLVQQALVQQWGIDSERAELLARLSHGCIGWAISAVSDEKRVRQRSDNLTNLIDIINSDVTERFAFAAELATRFGENRASVREQLELWLTWWRDLLLMKNGHAEFGTNIDRKDVLQQKASQYTLSAIRGAIKSIQETMSELEKNANPRLALEVLMLSIPIERETSYA